LLDKEDRRSTLEQTVNRPKEQRATGGVHEKEALGKGPPSGTREKKLARRKKPTHNPSGEQIQEGSMAGSRSRLAGIQKGGDGQI